MQGLMRHAILPLKAWLRVHKALRELLITKPKILLLDEPLSDLGASFEHRYGAELKQMQRDGGITFIHVTHSQHEPCACNRRRCYE